MAHSESTEWDVCSNCWFESALKKITDTRIVYINMVMNWKKWPSNEINACLQNLVNQIEMW